MLTIKSQGLQNEQQQKVINPINPTITKINSRSFPVLAVKMLVYLLFVYGLFGVTKVELTFCWSKCGKNTALSQHTLTVDGSISAHTYTNTVTHFGCTLYL